MAVLGIEGGGTKTIAVMVDESGQLVSPARRYGPGNFRTLSRTQFAALLAQIAKDYPVPGAVGLGLAGVKTTDDQRAVEELVRATPGWEGVHCAAAGDLEIVLEAEEGPGGARATQQQGPVAPTVLVLAGTGSCVLGRLVCADGTRRHLSAGGWGRYLGDEGSGVDLGLQACKAVLRNLDRTGPVTETLELQGSSDAQNGQGSVGCSTLRQRILASTGGNEPCDILDWASQAYVNSPEALAGLSREVFRCAEKGDAIALAVMHSAADGLVTTAVSCALRALRLQQTQTQLQSSSCSSTASSPSSSSRPASSSSSPATTATNVQFLLAGGLLHHEPSYCALIEQKLKTAFPQATIKLSDACEHNAAKGAAYLVTRKSHATQSAANSTQSKQPPRKKQRLDPSLELSRKSPTEERNSKSMTLDKMTARDAIALMLAEEKEGVGAVEQEVDKIETIALWVAAALRQGGRLFYVGAGTSGRLGVLDATECPPTFRAHPEQVQGILAGGHAALTRSVEGAEDSETDGGLAVRYRGVRASDVLVGIAASGRTPFVWGALQEAAEIGTRTALVCFNHHITQRSGVPELILAPKIGPEVLTGSTRLKAGTATKLILNCITTTAMIQLGKVEGNLMVDVDPLNDKLRDRAIRIVCTLTGADEERAEHALQEAKWVVKAALDKLRPAS